MLPRVQWIMGRGSFIHPGGDDWKRRRHLLQGGLTRAASIELARCVPAATHKALERLHESALKGEPVDIHRQMGLLIVDVTLQSLFSADVGDRLESIYEQTQFLLESFTSRLPVPLPTVGNYRFRRVARKLQGFMRKLIDQRLQSSEKPPDLLTLLMAADKQTGQSWPVQDVQDEMFSFYFGASIMKIGLAWICYLLSQHPHVYSKLHSEVNEVLKGRAPRRRIWIGFPMRQWSFRKRHVYIHQFGDIQGMQAKKSRSASSLFRLDRCSSRSAISRTAIPRFGTIQKSLTRSDSGPIKLPRFIRSRIIPSVAAHACVWGEIWLRLYVSSSW